MILSEKFNPHMKKSEHFFGKLGTFLIFKKGQERLLPTSYQPNIKKFNARLLFASTAKMDNKYSSKLTPFFSFALVIASSESLFT